MHRIDNSSAIAVMPARKPAGTAGYFTQGNPQTGLAATIVEADILNAVMMEIANVVTLAGLVLSKTNDQQLWQAINQLINAARLSFVPVEQGGGAGQGANKVRMGWATDGSGVKVQVDATDLGLLAFLARAQTWSAAQAFQGITATDVGSSGNIHASGSVSGSYVASSGGIDSATYVSAGSGNVTANNGKVRATFGHGGDPNAAPILSDFGNVGSFGAFIIQAPKFLMQGATVACAVGDFALSQPVGASQTYGFAWPTVFPEICCGAWGCGNDSGIQEGSEMAVGMVNFTQAGGTFRVNRVSGSNTSPPGGETFITQVFAIGR